MTALIPPPTPTDAGPRIQILYVSGCPNVKRLLRAIERNLERLELPATIELIEGPYPSPTLVVNGIEVNAGTAGSAASCRLDLPTEQQVVDALTAARTELHHPWSADSYRELGDTRRIMR